MKKNLGLVFSAILLMAIGAPIANADGTFDYTISGADTGNIAITVTGGQITGLTGTFDGSTISSFYTTLGEFDGNDTNFSTTQPFIDEGGIAFTLSSPDTNGFDLINLYSDFLHFSCASGNAYCSDQALLSSPGSITTFGTDNLTSTTPEPSAACLTLIGAGILLVMRKRLGHAPVLSW